MKTLNAGNRINISATMKAPIILDDKMPCWYADFEKGDNRKDCVWRIGVKREREAKEEFSFKAGKAGDISSDAEWSRITSVDFATDILDKFKTGGQEAVKEWLKKGCP